MAHFKWAPGMRVVSQTAASTSPWGPPAGYPAMRVRTCGFNRAELMFGKDLPEVRGALHLLYVQLNLSPQPSAKLGHHL